MALVLTSRSGPSDRGATPPPSGVSKQSSSPSSSWQSEHSAPGGGPCSASRRKRCSALDRRSSGGGGDPWPPSGLSAPARSSPPPSPMSSRGPQLPPGSSPCASRNQEPMDELTRVIPVPPPVAIAWNPTSLLFAAASWCGADGRVFPRRSIPGNRCGLTDAAPCLPPSETGAHVDAQLGQHGGRPAAVPEPGCRARGAVPPVPRPDAQAAAVGQLRPGALHTGMGRQAPLSAGAELLEHSAEPCGQLLHRPHAEGACELPGWERGPASDFCRPWQRVSAAAVPDDAAAAAEAAAGLVASHGSLPAAVHGVSLMQDWAGRSPAGGAVPSAGHEAGPRSLWHGWQQRL
mmetsp:Transcript_3441/g.8141  ORF Transcript_3441/g.8141 Transcript_3441/m.8141 type:complete len:347 (-) Transcript_3441:131-1171(-)